MNPKSGDRGPLSDLRTLADYVDGQLDPDARRRVEALLANQPELAEDLRAQAQFMRDYRQGCVPEPPEEKWAAALDSIAAAAKEARTSRASIRSPGRFGKSGWIAAAVLIAVLIPTLPRAFQIADPGAAPVELASDDDVLILKIDDGDHSALLVGSPPLPEPIVLASSGEVELEHVEPDTDGMLPSIRMVDWPSAPMIVAPLGAGQQKAP